MRSPDHERKAVISYVEAELSAADPTVLHAEKVAAETVGGQRYEVWDVHTVESRWWAITPPANLYDQIQFPSMDAVLSFHVGLMMRVMARGMRTAPAPSRLVFRQAWRRWEQAGSAVDSAIEGEDFQAVGMLCRETLIALVEDARESLANRAPGEPPKAADFLGWSEILARALAPGKSLERVRSHLKSSSKSAWLLLQWLTHARNATRIDAELAVGATEQVLSAFSLAALRDYIRRCPECGSSQLADSWGEDGRVTSLCVACTYRSEPWEPSMLDNADSDDDTAASAPEGDCVVVETPIYGPSADDEWQRRLVKARND
jgi:hypothetical protein